MIDQVLRIRWYQVPALAVELCEKTATAARAAQEALRQLPLDDLCGVFYQPELQLFRVVTANNESETRRKYACALAHPVLTVDERKHDNATWVPVFVVPWNEKRAYSPTLKRLAQLLLISPSDVSQHIPCAGSPLASILAGGMLGAATGYGAGWLGEQVLPKKWKRNRLRWTLAALGGLTGAAPGMLGAAVHARQGRSILEPGPLYENPAQTWGGEVPASSGVGKYTLASAAAPGEVPPQVKEAIYSETGAFGPVLGAPPIPVDRFNQTVWQDPYVAPRLSPVQQAAISGLVTGAAYEDGRKTRFVTPLDVARMTAGMGSGYISGALVGKALGLLTGMPDSTQDTLKRTGLWAGVVANLVPIAFGR